MRPMKRVEHNDILETVEIASIQTGHSFQLVKGPKVMGGFIWELWDGDDQIYKIRSLAEMYAFVQGLMVGQQIERSATTEPASSKRK